MDDEPTSHVEFSIDDFVAQKIREGVDPKKTAPIYERLLRRFEAFLNSRDTTRRRLISEATKSDVEHFVSYLLKTNKPKTVSSRIAPLREYFKYRRQRGEKKDDPTLEVRLPKPVSESTKRFVLSRSEIDKLLNAPTGLYGLRDRAIIRLLYSGLKRLDIHNASIHDFERRTNTLKVAGRVVPLTNESADAIDAYLQVRPAVKDSALFLSNRLGRMGLRQIWLTAKKYIRKCGLNNMTTLQTLRDTYVVHALDDRVDLRTIRAAHGNADGPWLRDLISLTQTSEYEDSALRLAPPDFSKLTTELALQKVLRTRWNEAQSSVVNENYLASLILMGSLLEGALLAIIRTNPQQSNQSKPAPRDSAGGIRKFKDWTLSSLIDVAHDCGWLNRDVKDFSHLLRDYRNMVHPLEQVAMKMEPDSDTCRICWQVVRAALNDLADASKLTD